MHARTHAHTARTAQHAQHSTLACSLAASMCQKDEHGQRTDVEQALFQRALGSLDVIYAHEAMATLQKFRAAHPTVDIRAHLDGVSSVYRSFVLTQLAKLEERDAEDGRASKQERLKQLKHKLRNTED